MSQIGYTLAEVNRNYADSHFSEKKMPASLTVKEGKTRGKNPRKIEYEIFDLEKPETLPATLKEFTEVAKVADEKELLSLVINGFNDAQYSAASDEIGEFINDAWDKETQNQFRLAVRNYSKLTGQSVEDAVNLMKPAIDKGWEAKVAAKKAEAEKSHQTQPTA